ncbi:Erythronate-4-phosphate dehydrogenase [Parasponia andersonii]|uniref:Erythronate-4-phosphate dehydrogenase n=1 Tax=Parasponia andersonii TaxID=3476 RepID=A0A2P5C904_PARAD|nr:Erythronate-4-phosphate dehydrogenase [Parasponia andersonii]
MEESELGSWGSGKSASKLQKKKVFGCRITYDSRKEKPSVSFPYFSNFCDLASESDILVVCCALTAETHHIISKDVMKALGKK